MKLVLLTTITLLAIEANAKAPRLTDELSNGHATAVWSCNAYGYAAGARGYWKTIMGPDRTTKEAAKDVVMIMCRSQLSGCQPSGCWQK